MKYAALLLTTALIFAGCGGSESAPAPETREAAATVDRAAALPAKAKTIGDLEAEVDFELTLDEETAPPGVTMESLRSQRKKLNMVTVTVPGARPDALWLSIDLGTRLSFPERPVVASGRLIRDLENGQEETLFTFETIFDENASRSARREEGDYPPQHFRAEVLQGLEEMPETMLVYAEMDVVITPRNVDPAGVDPAADKGDPEERGTLVSNPLRVNFEPGDAAPAATPEPEAPADAEPAGVEESADADDAGGADAPAGDDAAPEDAAANDTEN